MKCPRCKSPVENKDALYCLTCGKQLKRDDGFDGEFEKEFRFDEEIEAEKQAEEERTRLLRRQHLFTVLKVTFGAVFVALFVLLLYLLLRPSERVNLSGDGKEVDANTPAPQAGSAEELCGRLLSASLETYDLTELLSCVPPQTKEAVCEKMMRQFSVQSREELESALKKLAAERGVKITEWSVTFTTLSNEEAASVKALLNTEYDNALTEIQNIQRAHIVFCSEKDGNREIQSADYLIGTQDGVCYALDI